MASEPPALSCRPDRPPSRRSTDLSINELILAYFRHVQAYYVKDGQPTSEQDNIRQALRFIRQLYGTSPAMDFGPMALKNVRQAMIDAGRSRKLINKDVNRVRQMFGWAVENELLPVAVSPGPPAGQGAAQGPLGGPGDRAGRAGVRGAYPGGPASSLAPGRDHDPAPAPLRRPAAGSHLDPALRGRRPGPTSGSTSHAVTRPSTSTAAR